MNKIKFVLYKFILGVVILSLTTPFKSFSALENSLTHVHKDQLKERIENIRSEIDLRYTTEVHSIINTYIKNYRVGSEILLGRTEKYFPIYEQEFEKQGVPRELKYVSVVESSLIPRAISHVGATGLWQFMKATGRLYGLTINSAVDERKDPIRSTSAASNYLKDLYHEFGDWTLALAAYNCGPGNVRKALNRSGRQDFWEIKNYLPRETRRYIPKYVAIAYVMNYFHLHGLEPMMDEVPNRFATAIIYDYQSFKDISAKSGADLNTIYHLNPAFLKGYVPKSTKGYLVTLPEQEMYNFLIATDGFDNLIYSHNSDNFLNSTAYLYSSMKRRVSEFIQAENIPSLQLLKVTSENTIVPSDLGRMVPGITVIHAISDNNPGNFIHNLEPSQTLIDLSELYAIELTDLIEANNLSLKDPPVPGSKIRIPKKR